MEDGISLLCLKFQGQAVQANTQTLAGGYATETAIALTKLCYDILLKEGTKAKLAVENKVVTKSVEKK